MTRDLTEDQFRAALKRHGFGLLLGSWITSREKPSLWVGIRLKKRRGQWEIDRRASLAKAIKLFAEHKEKTNAQT
jgi:hypothetical protein